MPQQTEREWKDEVLEHLGEQGIASVDRNLLDAMHERGLTVGEAVTDIVLNYHNTSMVTFLDEAP